MNNIPQRVDKIIEDQVQAQKFIGFGGDVLCINGAVFLADLVCQRQHQRTRTRSRVINRHIADVPLYHDPGNNSRNGVRGVVLCIFAEILVIVFD